jgi:hypothetical protein
MELSLNEVSIVWFDRDGYCVRECARGSGTQY